MNSTLHLLGMSQNRKSYQSMLEAIHKNKSCAYQQLVKSMISRNCWHVHKRQKNYV